ncbi:MAG: sigma 54-interacting transcriptional regulator [Acidobacteriota bacterium]
MAFIHPHTPVDATMVEPEGPGPANRACTVAHLLSRGRCAAAERLLRREIGHRRRRGQYRAAGEAALELGYQHLLWGRPALALSEGAEAEELCSEGGWPCGIVAGRLLRAWALCDDDRIAEAEATLRLAVSPSVGHDHLGCHRAATLSLAHCLTVAGRFDEARAALAALEGALPTRWRGVDAVADGDGAGEPTDPWTTTIDSTPRLLPCRHEVLSAQLQIRLALAASDIGRAASLLTQTRQTGAPSADVDRVWLAVADVRVRGAQRRWLDVSRASVVGRRAARQAHAPAMGLELRLVQAEVLGEMGQVREAARLVGRLQQSTWPAPARLRRRLSEAAGRFGPTRGDGPGAPACAPVRLDATDVMAILQACAERDDDLQGLAAVCASLRSSLRAATVAVFGRHAAGAALAAAGGRIVSAGLVSDVLASGRPTDLADLRLGGEAAVPIGCARTIDGALAAKWSTPPDSLAAGHLALLRAAALAVLPAVRALTSIEIDRSSAGGVLAAIAGTSASVVDLRDRIAGAALAPFPVLIQGESGCGKELVAKSVHAASQRRARRFCAVNCAALPDELCEAELFGHARGAFTGAATERAGLFEEADGGTLFLDEVGELSPRAQAKLLRAIQEGEVRRLGENAYRRVDPRIVAASNRSLHDEVDAGRFRADLLFRLDVIRIRVPALRERPEDVACLAADIWRSACERLTSRADLAPATVAALSRYHWPGNVRELQNVLCALAAFAPRRGRVGPDRLPDHIKAARRSVVVSPTLAHARREFDRGFVQDALVRAGSRPSRAAELLGVTRQGLAKLLARLDLNPGPRTREDRLG